MCLFALKKNSNRIDLLFARDETNRRHYLEYGKWWKQHPGVYGYLDIKTNGTWLANNESLFACILNRELVGSKMQLSRGNIILDILIECKECKSVIAYCNKKNYYNYSPFNLIFVDKSGNVIYLTNRTDDNKPCAGIIEIIQLDFFMLNRSFINDFSQIRIRNNYFSLNSLLSNGIYNNQDLYNYLSREAYTESEKSETTIKLISKEWKTQIISLVCINSNTIDVKTLCD